MMFAGHGVLTGHPFLDGIYEGPLGILCGHTYVMKRMQYAVSQEMMRQNMNKSSIYINQDVY
jgi:hypothetical protein